MLKDKLGRSPRLLVLLSLGLMMGLAPLARLARADIINDVEELEKEKDPEKKPEKKKDKSKDKEKAEAEKNAEAEKPTAAGTAKKPAKNKSPVVTENPDPETQTLIPEPIDEPVGTNPPAKAPALKSAKGKSKEQRKKAPVHLQSEGTATYSKDRMTVNFQKNVTITQDDLRLQSEEAKVNFMPKDSAEKIKNAVLEGKVAIARYSTDPSERVNAKSDRATFDNLKQVVILDGNARLWRDGDLLKGERIVYDLTTGMVTIEKAQGVVQPDRMKK